MENRLLRNEHDKVIAGVSSGLASYMEVDVTIIRLLFVLSTIFLVGTGILVYLVMWIVVPVNNDPAAKFSKFNEYFKQSPPTGFNPPHGGFYPPNAGFTSPPVPPAAEPNPFAKEEAFQPKAEQERTSSWQNPVDFKALPKNNGTGRTVGGLFLLVIGLYFLMNEFDIIPYWFRLGKLWPLVFVAIGLSFILKSKRKNNWEQWKREQEQAFKQSPESKPADERPADERPAGEKSADEKSADEKKAEGFDPEVPNEEPKGPF